MPISTTILGGIVIKASEVWETLCAFDLNKAQGIDGISSLDHVQLLSLPVDPQHHILPMEWQIHSITPIFKSGNRSYVNNYRPISLLCSTSKVLERIIHNKCIDFVSSKISPNQFGFLANRSSLQRLLILVDNAYKEIDRRSQVDIIYTDFKRLLTACPRQYC